MPKVVITVDGVMVGAFNGILFDFFYYNYSSKYIIKPYRSTIIDLLLGVRYINRERVNSINITSGVVA